MRLKWDNFYEHYRLVMGELVEFALLMLIIFKINNF